MGANLIAWIKEEFVLLVLTNNKDMNRRWLTAQIKDPESIQISLDWHRGEHQEQNGAKEQNQLIRKMQLNYCCEVGEGLDSPVCVYWQSEWQKGKYWLVLQSWLAFVSFSFKVC